MTEFQEKLDKTRAVEGELQRTIDGLNEVDTSRVHIATPDQSLYSSSQEPTTASIAIKTAGFASRERDRPERATATHPTLSR